MRRIILPGPWLSLLGLLLSACPAGPIQLGPTYSPPESLVLRFDSREWVLANKQSKPGYTLTEYLLAGQSPSNFTESLGATYVSYDTGAQLQTEAERLRKGVHAVCPDAQWEVLTQTPTELVYVWRIQKCSAQPDQYEIGRFIATSTGIHRAAYVAKASDLDPNERQRWVNLLSQAQVTQNRQVPQ